MKELWMLDTLLHLKCMDGKYLFSEIKEINKGDRMNNFHNVIGMKGRDEVSNARCKLYVSWVRRLGKYS